ncbi:MAG TPA: GNAT family N-acetyltransferase [Geobacteraceae bacterium]|nr:GNAT family N-acetyltransferase [Geobacteraceae bacterium]
MNQILHANIANAGEILDLQKLAYQSEAIIYNDWSIPPLTQTLEEVIKEFTQTTFLKACNYGKIIGSVRALMQNRTCEIGRLIVHPDFQGKGIGTQLMLAVEAEFPTATRFELYTGSKSEGNIRLYERLGYRIFSRKPLSQLVELVFMEKGRIAFNQA